MSTIAGKVAPVPKGAWDNATSYTKLNIVSHNGYAYMAKQDNVGQEPTAGSSDTYWMFLVAGGGTPVDSAMSTTSTNPVQNAVISAALGETAVEVEGVSSEQWNATTAYAVGDYAIYYNKLYRCLVANTGSIPATTPADWESTSVSDELNALNSDTWIELYDSTTSGTISGFNKSNYKEILITLSNTDGRFINPARVSEGMYSKIGSAPVMSSYSGSAGGTWYSYTAYIILATGQVNLSADANRVIVLGKPKA